MVTARTCLSSSEVDAGKRSRRDLFGDQLFPVYNILVLRAALTPMRDLFGFTLSSSANHSRHVILAREDFRCKFMMYTFRFSFTL